MLIAFFVAAGCLAALFTGTLVEYSLHRAMHAPRLRRRRPFSHLANMHLAHHRSNVAQPLLREAFDYIPVAFSMLPMGAGFTILMALWFGPAGWFFLPGWVAASVLYAVLVAVAHNLSHSGTYWCRFHARHHKAPRCNFGILCGAWDRAFRTAYKGD